MEDFVEFVTDKEPEQKPVSEAKAKRALNFVSGILTNKFLWVTVTFLLIMLFFDKNDIFTTIDRKQQLNDLEQSKTHYTQELQELKKIKNSLESDPATIEKLAREKYLMKRTNEDIFLTEDNSKKENKTEEK